MFHSRFTMGTVKILAFSFRRQPPPPPPAAPSRVVVYYCNRTALGLRCFRLALILHYKFLQRSEHYCPDEPNTDVAGTPEDEAKRVLYYSGVRDSGTARPAEAAAAAIVLNNVAVCLAVVGEAESAVHALVIASSITT